MNEKNDFNFDFTEKSTRKAVIFGAIFGFISAIFAWNDAFGRLYDWTPVVCLIYGVVVFVPSFFFGLIAFRSGNYLGFAGPPVILIISFFMPSAYRSGDFATLFQIIIYYILSLTIVLILSFLFGIITQWVQSGKE